jgi:uncharacterized membrane protein YfcA
VLSLLLSAGTPVLVVVLVLVLISVAAGVIGALLGLGGGIVLVPALVLLFGLNIHLAIAASLVSVIATSSGSASTFVEEGLTDLRIGMFLEVATVVGGLVGAVVSAILLSDEGQYLVLAFVPVILLAAVFMYRSRARDVDPSRAPDRVAVRLRLGGEYYDEQQRRTVPYRVTGTGIGLGFAGISGVVSGLLGIGGGTFNVPAMNAFMNVPIRVAGATSNFMIGVTAAAGALVYVYAGDVGLTLVAPVVLGIFVGSLVGTSLHRTVRVERLKGLFVAVLVVAAILMLLRAIGVLG